MDKLVDYLCIIQARINSSRLPSKVMLDLAGKTLLERVYESVNRSQLINKIVVATSINYTDDIIANKLKLLNIPYYRGSLDNVLKRFYDTAVFFKAKNIIRVTADNALTDGRIIDKLINIYKSREEEYCKFSNSLYGLGMEVFSFNILKKAYLEADDNYSKEHVTPYIYNNYNVYITDIEDKYKNPNIRITIDTLEDYIKMQKFYLYCQNKNIVADVDNFLIYQGKNL